MILSCCWILVWILYVAFSNEISFSQDSVIIWVGGYNVVGSIYIVTAIVSPQNFF